MHSAAVVLHLHPIAQTIIDNLPKKDKESSALPEPTNYLDKIDDFALSKIIHKLPKKYWTMTRLEAEQLLNLHHKKFRRELYLDRIANATNLIFVFYLINTGTAGFISFLTIGSGLSEEEIAKNSSIIDVGKIIVPLTSGIGALMWFAMSSPWTSALVATLRHATQEIVPFKKKILYAKKNPCETIRNLSLFATTNIINLSAASTEIFAIGTLFENTSSNINWLKWPLFIFTLYFAKRFCGHCWDDSAQENLIGFWVNEKNHTSLAKQFARGNIAASLKVFLEGLSATALKTLAYYFIAVASDKTLGWYFPPIFITSLAFMHSLLVNYPAAFENLLEPFEKFDKLLLEKLTPRIDSFFSEQLNSQHAISLVTQFKHQLIALDLNLTKYDSLLRNPKLDKKIAALIKSLHLSSEKKLAKDVFNQKVLKFNAELIESEMLHREGRLRFIKNLPLEMLNVFFGAYAGVRLLMPSFEPMMASYVSIPLSAAIGAGTVSSIFYKGALNAEYKKAACEEITGIREAKDINIGKGVSLFSLTLVFLSGFSNSMSNINTAGSLISGREVLMTLLVLAAIQKWLNDIRYNKPLVETTIDSWVKSITWCRKSNAVEIKTSSSCCSRLRFWKGSKKDDKATARTGIDIEAPPIVTTTSAPAF